MEILKNFTYGTNENTKEQLLCIDKIRIENYKDPEDVRVIMDILATAFTFYQYNNTKEQKAEDCDYFFWQFVDDKGNKNFQTVDISYYNNDIKQVSSMEALKNILETTYSTKGTIVQVYYKDVRDLIKKIEEEN